MIGDMRHRIQLLNATISESKNGFKQTNWAEVTTTWAAIQNQTLTEDVGNGKTTEQAAIEFTIRYRELSTANHIKYQNRTFKIESIENKDFQKKFLIILTKEVI